MTAIPGTTRDTVSENLVLEGIPVRLIDTAGMREGQDPVEKLGIERSYQAMADADLTLLVLDLSSDLEEEDRLLLEKLADRRPLIVGNKSDLPQVMPPFEVLARLRGDGLWHFRSQENHPGAACAQRPRLT